MTKYHTIKAQSFGARKLRNNSQFDVTELRTQLHTSVCFSV